MTMSLATPHAIQALPRKPYLKAKQVHRHGWVCVESADTTRTTSTQHVIETLEADPGKMPAFSLHMASIIARYLPEKHPSVVRLPITACGVSIRGKL